MLRKAVYGIVIVFIVTLIMLSIAGLHPLRAVRFFSKPYEQALAEGDYIAPMIIRVDSDTLEEGRTLKARMAIENPTHQPLHLVGRWETEKDIVTVLPNELDVTIKPGDTYREELELVVHQDVRVTEVPWPVFAGEWEWTRKWTKSRKRERAEEVTIPTRTELKVRRAFGTANTAALVAYLVGVLGIGFIASRKITSTRSYFIADAKVNPVIVGLSLLGTYLSALTMIGLSGMAYGAHNWTFVVQLPCLVLTGIVITGYVLPKYRAAGIISIYEYLEKQIHVSARIIAAVSFIIFAIGRTGLLLYLPALAFSTVTGTPLWLAIVGMGVIITIYTAVGGIKAVIWTDAIQVVLFIVAGLLTLVMIMSALGPARFIDIGLEYGKFKMLKPGFDPRQIVTAWLILETIFQTIRIYGTQQDMAQRYMTTESTEKANTSVWIAILGYIPLGFMFYLIGTALFAFFRAHPDVVTPEKADQMYPFYVVNYMHPGVAGVIIAAIFAAAMSSIDSLMNSNSTVCVEDFIKRFSRRSRTDEQYLRQARFLTLIWGTLAVILALMFMRIEYVQIVWGKLMGIATNGILGLMALAFIRVRVSKWAAVTGFAVSYVCLFLMMGTGINYLLWPVVGNTACFLVGLLTNPVYRAAEARTA